MDQNMIHALSSKTAYKPFANPICLWRSIRRFQLLDACCHCRKVCGIFLSRSRIKYFGPFPTASLLVIVVPSIRRLEFRNACMYDPSCFQFHHHEDMPLTEQPVIYYRKVACPGVSGLDSSRMSPKFGLKNVTFPLSVCISGYSVYSLLSPTSTILRVSVLLPTSDSLPPFLNQGNCFGSNLWLPLRFPPPVELKQLAMPAHKSVWLNDVKGLFPERRKMG